VQQGVAGQHTLAAMDAHLRGISTGHPVSAESNFGVVPSIHFKLCPVAKALHYVYGFASQHHAGRQTSNFRASVTNLNVC
jgi:hypothetical protein